MTQEDLDVFNAVLSACEAKDYPEAAVLMNLEVQTFSGAGADRVEDPVSYLF